MKCPHCGKDHPATAKYCENTGKKIESTEDFVICQNPECDYRQPLPISTKFCPNCGTSLLINTDPQRNVDKFLIVANMGNGTDIIEPKGMQVIYTATEDEEVTIKNFQGHDYAVISKKSDSWPARYDVISILGIRENVLYEDNVWADCNEQEIEWITEFKERNPQYSNVTYIKRCSPTCPIIFIADDNVVTYDGEILFEISKYRPLRVMTYGFIAYDPSSTDRCIMLDVNGEEMSKTFELDWYDGHYIFGFNITEIEGGTLIVDNERVIVPQVGMVFDGMLKHFFYIYKRDDKKFSVNLYRKDDLKLQYRERGRYKSEDDYTCYYDLTDDWTLVHHESNPNRQILIKGNTQIALDENETLLTTGYYEQGDCRCYVFEESFIGNGMIITSQQSNNIANHRYCEQYKLRDYDGNVIALVNPGFIFLKPYRYGKALALSEKDKTFYFFDRNGQPHLIPNISVSDISEEIDVTFVSDDVIAITFYEREESGMLININGDTIKKGFDFIEELAEGYLRFNDWEFGEGIMDSSGNILLEGNKYWDIRILK